MISLDITLIGVFGAGLLSFLSPCVLPLLPAYLTYMAGVSLHDLSIDRSSRIKIVINSVFFVLGFSVIFVSLGASASAIGGLIRYHQEFLSIVAGIIIILMGLHFLGLTRLALLNREWRLTPTLNPSTASNQSNGYTASFIMGFAFAFGWTPCIGPVLGAVLSVAATKESLSQGAGLLTIYSLGLGLPFIIAAAFTQPFITFLSRFKSRLHLVEKAMGVFLIFTGFLFLTGGMQYLAYYLLETFPIFQTIG